MVRHSVQLTANGIKVICPLLHSFELDRRLRSNDATQKYSYLLLGHHIGYMAMPVNPSNYEQ